MPHFKAFSMINLQYEIRIEKAQMKQAKEGLKSLYYDFIAVMYYVHIN